MSFQAQKFENATCTVHNFIIVTNLFGRSNTKYFRTHFNVIFLFQILTDLNQVSFIPEAGGAEVFGKVGIDSSNYLTTVTPFTYFGEKKDALAQITRIPEGTNVR
jgi:hypothetical protein